MAQVQELFCPQFTYSCHNAARPTSLGHFSTISAKALLDRQVKGLRWWSFWGYVNVPPKQVWKTSESVRSHDWFHVCNSSENKRKICSFLLTAMFKFALGNIPCRTKKSLGLLLVTSLWLHFKSMMPRHRWQSYLSIPFKHKTSKANHTKIIQTHLLKRYSSQKHILKETWILHLLLQTDFLLHSIMPTN